MNNPDLFVDGVLNVTLVKGMIRLDLFSLSATDYRDGQPQPEFRQRLVMSPQTLMGLQQELQAAIVALRERGLIPMTPAGGGPQMSAPLTAQAAPSHKAAAPEAPSAHLEPPSVAAGTEPAAAPASAAAAQQQPPSTPRTPRSPNFPSTMNA